MITPALKMNHALTRVRDRIGRTDVRVRDAALGLVVTTTVAAGTGLAGGSAAAAPSHHSSHGDHSTAHAALARPDRASHRPRHADHGRHRRQEPTARHDAAQTVKSAKHSSGNEPGYCLRWVHIQAGIPAKYLSASQAWQHAGDKHRGDHRPPPGAAVYWTGGSEGFGHIAISVGHGKVRSTDAGGEGTVATVRIGWAHRNWGLRYAGWSDQLNGRTIPGVAKHHRSSHSHR